MQVDWKIVCQCAGYKSLKAAVVKDLTAARKAIKKYGRHYESLKEINREFQKALSLVYRYSVASGISFEDALGKAEADRTYSWRSYYQTCHVEKALGFKIERNIKQMGARGTKKWLKKMGASPERIKQRMLEFKRK